MKIDYDEDGFPVVMCPKCGSLNIKSTDVPSMAGYGQDGVDICGDCGYSESDNPMDVLPHI